MSIIHNERANLLPVTLKTSATSSFTVAALAPIAAAFHNFGVGAVPLQTIIISVVILFAAAVAHHLGARRTLKGLQE